MWHTKLQVVVTCHCSCSYCLHLVTLLILVVSLIVTLFDQLVVLIVVLACLSSSLALVDYIGL